MNHVLVVSNGVIVALLLSGIFSMFFCLAAGYREIVMRSLPQISVLDGLDRFANPSHQGEGSPYDLPGFEHYVDLLISSDTSHNETVMLYLDHYVLLVIIFNFFNEFFSFSNVRFKF